MFNPPKSHIEWALVIEKALRICLFITTLVIYFGLRIDNRIYDDSDAERQTLLHKKLGKKPDSEESTTSGNGYGATTSTKPANNTVVPDRYEIRTQQLKDAMAKRLEQDGSWYTYAKGFAVSSTFGHDLHVTILTCHRYFFLTFGLSITNPSSSELYLWAVVC